MSVIRPVVKHEQERRGAFPGNPGNDTGGTYGSWADTDLDSINSGFDQGSRALPGCDVPADDL